MKKYIGVDLGGTNVRAAIVNENGEILEITKQPTEINKGVEYVTNKIIDMIKSLNDYQNCEGIGIGVPGPVNTKEGKMVMATNLPGFENYPLAKKISDATGLKCYMDNDVNVAALGVSVFGKGKDKDSIYYVTISTGIGGAFVFNKQIVSGAHGYGGEIGNIIIDQNREKVNALNAGAVECEASGTGITRKAQNEFENINNAGDFFELAKAKDSKAVQLLDQITTDLAVMFSTIAHVVDPDLFVVGGGCMKSKDVFLDEVITKFKDKIHPGMQSIKIEECSLDEPGILGAAMLPMTHK